MSGVASIGRRWKLQAPIAQSSTTAARMAQRNWIAAAMMRSRSAGRSDNGTASMVMAGSGLLDLGAAQEGPIGHIVGVGFESAQDLGPFGTEAPVCAPPDHICVAHLGKEHDRKNVV